MIEESVLSSINPSTPIILASGSESRRIMLEDAGIKFKVITSEVDEDIIKKEYSALPFTQQVIKLAAAKASEVSKHNPESIVIGGDQMCVLDNTLFDKPGTSEKAIENLKYLSGKTHHQHSGVCIFKDNESIWEYSEVVELNMHSLSDQEIINYVKIENPIHAAGAYKFESLGCNLFSSVDGSSYTIRGMPLLALLKALRELNIINLENIV
jgi:septum formation protein|tara:strand:+ start:665 stop:1297 length:633 start_codon:yes stop_codon:yes gene_type:complete